MAKAAGAPPASTLDAHSGRFLLGVASSSALILRVAHGEHFGRPTYRPTVTKKCAGRTVGAARNAILDLRDLLAKVGVAARVENLELDALTTGFFDDAVGHTEPVRILHVWERHADVPLLGGLGQRRVVDRGLFAVRRKGRDGRGLVRKPVRSRSHAVPCPTRAAAIEPTINETRRAELFTRNSLKSSRDRKERGTGK